MYICVYVFMCISVYMCSCIISYDNNNLLTAVAVEQWRSQVSTVHDIVVQ